MNRTFIAVAAMLVMGGAALAAPGTGELSKPLANCMVNLGKHAPQLQLSTQQQQRLDAWRQQMPSHREALEQQAVAARAALRDASFNAAPLPVRTGLARQVGKLEAELVLMRSNCVVYVKSVLTPPQFAKLRALGMKDMKGRNGKKDKGKGPKHGNP